MSDQQNTTQQKIVLRAELHHIRNAMPEIQKEISAQAVAHADLSKLGLRQDHVIAGYHPIKSEFSALPLMIRLEREGLRLALPVVIGDEQPLQFKAWTSSDNLIKGPFGIAEPEPDTPDVLPDILFIPLLAFDKEGYRLGYGKGHYDRTLSALRAAKKITAIGLAFACQEVDQIPHDRYDQRLDFILTPSGLREFI